MKKLICLLSLVSVIVSCKKNVPEIEQPYLPVLALDSLEVLAADIPLSDYTDLVFLRSNLGYAVSNDGLIVRTTDGGLHWQEMASVGVPLRRIRFVNDQTGYAVGGNAPGAYLFKTTDAGVTWQKSELQTPSSNWPTGLYFVNNNTGFITGPGFFMKTTDGGATWTEAAGNATDNFIDVKFRNQKEGYATANGGAYYKTMNGGVSWTLQAAASTDHLGEIFITPTRMYAKSGAHSLVDLATGNVALTIPDAVLKIVFLSDVKAVGVGQHYETGFWPYGDIFLTNNAWEDHVSRKFMPDQAINFSAIARVDDRRTIMIGGGHLQTTVVQLNH